MPDEPVQRAELDGLVRAEVQKILHRNLARIAAVIVCVWLVGGITVLGVGYLYVTQKNSDFAYAVNANSCNARLLIDKQISDTRKALAGYVDAASDPTSSPSAQERNAQRIKDANRSLVGLAAFRRLYHTIPDSYDCRRLPREP